MSKCPRSFRKSGVVFFVLILAAFALEGCSVKNFRFRKYEQEGIVRKIKIPNFYGTSGTIESLADFQRYLQDGKKHRVDFDRQMIVVATTTRWGYEPVIDILRVERKPDRLVVVYEVRKKPMAWLKPRENYCTGNDAAVIRKTGLPVDFLELP